jgi:hypothetical protein
LTKPAQTGKNTFRIVSYARKRHARVQQSKFCRLYSGDIVEMLFDTQGMYAVQILEVSVHGMPLMDLTPVVPSLYAFETQSGDVPETSSLAAKQALHLGKQPKESTDGASAEVAHPDASAALGAAAPILPVESEDLPPGGAGSPSGWRNAGSAIGNFFRSLIGTRGSPAPLDGLHPPGLAPEVSGMSIDHQRGDDDDGLDLQILGEDSAFELAARAAEAEQPLARLVSETTGEPVASASSSMPSLGKMPSHVLKRAFSYLQLHEVLSVAAVCRRWETLIHTGRVLTSLRLGKYLAGVQEPPFRLLLNIATKSRYCIEHLSLSRCRWVTAGHLALLLGIPLELRPHPFSVAVEEPMLDSSTSRLVDFAPDGTEQDPCCNSPTLVAHSIAHAPESSLHALPFNLLSPETLVDPLARDMLGNDPKALRLEISGAERWRLRYRPTPRRLLDAFLALSCNRTLRAMSVAEARAIHKALWQPAAPIDLWISDFLTRQQSLVKNQLSRRVGPFISRTSMEAFSQWPSIDCPWIQPPLIAPRDSALETDPEDIPEPAASRRVTVASLQTQVTPTEEILSRACLAAWADTKLESLRPGVPGGVARSPAVLFRVKETQLRGEMFRGPRKVQMVDATDDAESTRLLDVATGNVEHSAARRAFERPARGPFLDHRLGRYPLGYVCVASSGEAVPSSSVSAPVPKGDAPLLSETREEDEGASAKKRATDASSDSEEDGDESFGSRKAGKVSPDESTVVLRPGSVSLGPPPTSPFAVLDSRARAVDAYFFFVATSFLSTALQEHVASNLEWTSCWKQARTPASRDRLAGIPLSSVVTWIPSPAEIPTRISPPRPIAERRPSSSTSGWAPPSTLRRVTDPVPSCFASGITSLDINGCLNIEPHALTILLRFCPSLTSLRLGGMLHLTSQNLKAIAMCAPNLTWVDLESLLAVNDSVIHAFATHCPGLCRVNLDGCSNLTDEAFLDPEFGLAVRCKRIAHISMRGCSRITSGGFEKLGELCGLRMRSLDLTGNQDITVLSLAKFLTRCADIESLKLEIWQKQENAHARFRILETAKRAARYCFKVISSEDPVYAALASIPQFAEAKQAADEALAGANDGDEVGTPA